MAAGAGVSLRRGTACHAPARRGEVSSSRKELTMNVKMLAVTLAILALFVVGTVARQRRTCRRMSGRLPPAQSGRPPSRRRRPPAQACRQRQGPERRRLHLRQARGQGRERSCPHRQQRAAERERVAQTSNGFSNEQATAPSEGGAAQTTTELAFNRGISVLGTLILFIVVNGILSRRPVGAEQVFPTQGNLHIDAGHALARSL